MKNTFGASAGLETEFIAVQTVAAVEKNGRKLLHVNLILDEGSDTSYVNKDVTRVLALREDESNVKVANDETILAFITHFA